MTDWFTRRLKKLGQKRLWDWYVGMWAITSFVVVLGLSDSSQRFLRAYVIAFAFLVTLGLGALFFVLLHHLVHARWSLKACLRMERMGGVLDWAPLLFLPIMLNAKGLYPWMRASSADLLRHPAKAVYWTTPFFLGRSALYLGTWWGLAALFRHRSDGSAPLSDAWLRRLSGPSMVAFGLTTIFAAFDWWMSLDRDFHSGMFGVYLFAGAVVSGLAILAIVTELSLRGSHQSNPSDIEERHDIGKLLFGFVTFWGYIAFCQYLIIWYANLPAEMAFYSQRWSDPWRVTTTLLVMLHFIFPFVVLLSRNTKRSAIDLVAISVIVLTGHAIDMIWLMAPLLQPSGPKLGLAEIGAACVAFSTTVALARSALSIPVRVPEDGTAIVPSAPPRDGAMPGAFAFGAHIALLPALRSVAGRSPPHSGWRLVATSFAVATLAMVGGSAAASDLGSRLRREVTRKNSESVRRAILAQTTKRYDELRWIDQESGKIQIPLEVAKGLVLADYASKSAKTTRTPGSSLGALAEKVAPAP